MPSCISSSQLDDTAGGHQDLELSSRASVVARPIARLKSETGCILEKLGQVMSGFGMYGAVNMLGYGFECGVASDLITAASTRSDRHHQTSTEMRAVAGTIWVAR